MHQSKQLNHQGYSSSKMSKTNFVKIMNLGFFIISASPFLLSTLEVKVRLNSKSVCLCSNLDKYRYHITRQLKYHRASYCIFTFSLRVGVSQMNFSLTRTY